MSEDQSRAAACSDFIRQRDHAAQSLGIEVTHVGPHEAKASMTVAADMINAFGICHGGYIFVLADTVFEHACNTEDNVNLAAAAQIEFLRAARLGDRLSASARQVERAGRAGIYDVTVTDQHGKRIAIFRGRSHALNQPILTGAVDSTAAASE